MDDSSALKAALTEMVSRMGLQREYRSWEWGKWGADTKRRATILRYWRDVVTPLLDERAAAFGLDVQNWGKEMREEGCDDPEGEMRLFQARQLLHQLETAPVLHKRKFARLWKQVVEAEEAEWREAEIAAAEDDYIGGIEKGAWEPSAERRARARNGEAPQDD